MVKFKLQRKRLNLTKKVKFSNWRFVLLYNGILLSLVFLLIRIAWLQIFATDMLIQKSNARSLRTKIISAPRGMITDRSGQPLAISVPASAIWVDPKELHNMGGITPNKEWKTLSDILKIPLDQIIRRISTNSKGRFVYLARQVNLNTANYIIKLKIPGVHLREESHRYYPSGEVTAHLIGFTDVDNCGVEGVEKSFNKWLTGHQGEWIVRKDRSGRIIEDISFTSNQLARNIVLSVDKRLQAIVYRELKRAVTLNKANSGSAVLVDICTGEILAMANSPSYNPNHFSNVKKEVIRNRAITDAFEPGSTVKPMVIMTALKCGVINKNSILNTSPFHIDGHEIKDIAQYNELTVSEILQKSSNVGVSKLALAMPFSALMDTYSRFGVGKSTNLGLVGERNGFYFQNKRRSLIEKATFSFGYGLTVTPSQLARVYATIGSYGIYRPLSIIKVNSPAFSKRVFPESIVKTVVSMMEKAALPGGSGAKAAIKGYRIAVKTGTVKKIDANGHYVNKYIAYTAGIAPVSYPRFSLVVIIDNPRANKYYGGVVSAPVFGSIMSSVLRIMKIEPDAL